MGVAREGKEHLEASLLGRHALQRPDSIRQCPPVALRCPFTRRHHLENWIKAKWNLCTFLWLCVNPQIPQNRRNNGSQRQETSNVLGIPHNRKLEDSVVCLSAKKKPYVSVSFLSYTIKLLSPIFLKTKLHWYQWTEYQDLAPGHFAGVGFWRWEIQPRCPYMQLWN